MAQPQHKGHNAIEIEYEEDTYGMRRTHRHVQCSLNVASWGLVLTPRAAPSLVTTHHLRCEG